jgi:hypothetical protein
MSPEHVLPAAGRASDLYSLGIVLQRCSPAYCRRQRSARHDPPGLPRWAGSVLETLTTARWNGGSLGSRGLREFIERYSPAATAWSLAGRAMPGLKQVGGEYLCVQCCQPVTRPTSFAFTAGGNWWRMYALPTFNAYVGAEDNFCILCGSDLRGPA